ncbi:translation initiation factor IF-2-like [Falco cherrug]|uniref:translation initiation factor IF-2-like n=1 Tax=Falco cherrug TaxID=345164 RepID=UPI0024789799|nr:translation initiation factor IF-2-like [Falco cherrug]
MVAERGRGEAGRGDGGGGSSSGRRCRRRVPALVAPTEGGGHRDPGAAADGDGREQDERAGEPLFARRSRDVREGDSRSASARERAQEQLRGQHRALKMAAPESQRHRPARTAQARSAARTKPSGPGGGQNLVLQAARLSGGFTRHRRSFSGEQQRRVQQRQTTSEPPPHQESGAHFPAPPPPRNAVTPRVTALVRHVMPSGAQPPGQGPGWGCSTQFSEGRRAGQGGKGGGMGRRPPPPA